MDFLTNPDSSLQAILLISGYSVAMTLIIFALLRKNRELIFWGIVITVTAILFMFFPDAFLSPGKFFEALKQFFGDL